VPHQVVSVEVDHNCGTTLYVLSQDEDAKLHKKQDHGMTCGGKC